MTGFPTLIEYLIIKSKLRDVFSNPSSGFLQFFIDIKNSRTHLNIGGMAQSLCSKKLIKSVMKEMMNSATWQMLN